MNVLTDDFPRELVIKGESYKIKYDFRTWIKFSQIMYGCLPVGDKIVKVLRLVFDECPSSLDEAITSMRDFYNPPKKQTKEEKKSKGKRVYDFEYDAELIYAAFFQQYGIDLSESDMHWHKFKLLFDNLTDITKFIKVVQYRSTDISKIKDKEQKKFYSEMKRMYQLPDNRTEKQKEEDFINNFVDKFI